MGWCNRPVGLPGLQCLLQVLGDAVAGFFGAVEGDERGLAEVADGVDGMDAWQSGE